MTNPLLAGGVLFLLFGFILHVVGMSTPGWLVSNDGFVHYGLFEVCINSTCLSYINVFGPLRAARALAISGAVISGVSILLGLVLIIRSSNPEMVGRNRRLGIYNGIKSQIAGCLIIAGAIVFALDFFDEDYLGPGFVNFSLDYSFFLCVFGGSFVGAGGSLAWAAVYKAYRDQQRALVQMGGFSPVCNVNVYQSAGSGAIYGQLYPQNQYNTMPQQGFQQYGVQTTPQSNLPGYGVQPLASEIKVPQ